MGDEQDRRAVLAPDLAQQVENLFFVFVIVREPTKNFESKFADWSEDLRGARTVDDVRGITQMRIAPEVQAKSRAFDFAMRELSAGSVPKYRLKYILGKLAQHVDNVAWQGAQSVRHLSHYLDGKLEIEHVFPQKPDRTSWPLVGELEDERRHVQQVGNLTLLEKPLNASVCNEGFGKKLEAYRDSKIMLTRAIGSPEVFGKNTSLQRALDLVKAQVTGGPAETSVHAYGWGYENIELRQAVLGKLAREVWGVENLCGLTREEAVRDA